MGSAKSDTSAKKDMAPEGKDRYIQTRLIINKMITSSFTPTKVLALVGATQVLYTGH
jgi:hypothetical protein